MNNVNLIGNLTRDPELRYSTGANQTAVCRFTIAVNDGYGDKQRTSFIPIVVFNKQAENCDRYLAKGRRVAVTGRIQTGSYEKDGRTVYTTDVIASNVEFLSSGQQGQGTQTGFPSQGGFDHQPDFQSQQGGFSQPAPAPSRQPEEIDVPGGFTSLQDDDIPF